MTKAKRQMQEDIKLVDLVIELVDARIPVSSRNPDIDTLGKGKARLILLNKSDLADERKNDGWTEFFKKKGYYVVRMDARNKGSMKQVSAIIAEACKEKTERDLRRGIKNRPVRAMVVGIPNVGKSTFIKRFMEQLVLPAMSGSAAARERARDELPQSAAGRTIMTTEPKFVPEKAVTIVLDGGVKMNVRLIDCVGYMIPGATGQMEGESPRMVSTPWLDHEVTMSEAAELGTTRVIREHSTIGVVVTTDGSITDIPREDYIEAEGRVIRELQEIGKPFLVLLNATEPESDRVQAMARDIASRYGVTCLPVNCLTLDDNAVGMILKAILYEFPLCELDLFIPPWVEALADDHPIKSGLYQAIRENTGSLHCIREVQGAISAIGGCESVSSARITSIQLGTGVAAAELQLPRALFYRTLSEQSGFDVKDDGDLLSLLTELSSVKAEYDKVAQAVSDARERGYGIVVPTVDELNLEEPEIMKQGGRYGVRLKASAPSLHIIRADIETTVSPIVGNEKQSEDMVNYLLQEFEGDTTKIWQSNIFGRSFHEIVNEDLQAKLKHMPDDARLKLRQTLERIINEGTGGLICIIL